MDGLRISELAERTGFSPATLRYYERVGVLPPPRRTGAGYREYDDRAVDRLRFVARAKSLGLSLDETSELAALWSGDRCAPVQERLAELLEAKLADARGRIAELTAFVSQLEAVAGMLGTYVPDGPCDDACGCTPDVLDTAAPVTFTGLGRVHDDAPIACTLAADEMGLRLDAWRALLAHAGAVTDVDHGVRIALVDTVDTAALVELAQAERACCSFLSFAVAIDRGGVALEVRGPDEARPVIDALAALAR
jgi:DNA-binding transcriptional MerR regulator